MKIQKTENEHDTYDIDLIKDGKTLSIDQEPSDLYIICKYNDWKVVSTIDYKITEEDEVYQYFDKLYNDIINGNIYEGKNKEKNKEVKNNANYKKIVKKGIITINCDSYPLDCPNTLKILKENNEIILRFIKDESKKMFKSSFMISINIKLTNSRLNEFYIPFERMFKSLQNVEATKEKTLVRK